MRAVKKAQKVLRVSGEFHRRPISCRGSDLTRQRLTGLSLRAALRLYLVVGPQDSDDVTTVVAQSRCRRRHHGAMA